MDIIRSGKIYAAEAKVRNLAFSIQFSQTNIRYLLDEPDNKERIELNKTTIQNAEKELEIAKQDLRFIRGF